MNDKKKCFVIMPFSETKSCSKDEWTGIFKGIIKPAVEESGLGYECERSVAERQNIIKGILEALNKANVVIADLTDSNPNVFYELGARHTLTNRTILIAQGEEHIPFDLRPYPVAFYNKSLTNIEEFKNDINKKLEDIETNPERLDNPVADFLEVKNRDILAYEKSATVKKLCALVSELSFNINEVDSILSIIKTSEEQRAKGEGAYVSNVRFDNACLERLLSTSYVTLSQKMLEDVKMMNGNIRIINNRLDLWPQESYEENVEKSLKKELPKLKKQLVSMLKRVGKIRIDYSNDNYLEPETPIMLLSKPEHQKYIEASD